MEDIKQFFDSMQSARKESNKSSDKFIASHVHDILADWLQDRDDPRSVLIRKRMKPRQADQECRRQTDSGFLGRWDKIEHRFSDGSLLVVIPHGLRTKRLNPDHVNLQNGDPRYHRSMMHVSWQKIPGLPGILYDTVMSKEDFQKWIRSFPQPEKTRLLITFQNNPHTNLIEESKTFSSFEDFLRNEMAGTGAIYDGTKSVDFNYWGSPQSMIKPKKKRSFKKFIESKKHKIHMSMNIEGEPVLVSDKKKSKGKLKRVLDIDGEPETI